ncbi:hypothetical protein ACVGX7_14375, partial [Enterobacter hormaechei]
VYQSKTKKPEAGLRLGGGILPGGGNPYPAYTSPRPGNRTATRQLYLLAVAGKKLLITLQRFLLSAVQRAVTLVIFIDKHKPVAFFQLAGGGRDQVDNSL